MSVTDVPIPGVTVCATLGLSDFPIGTRLGVELLIAAGSSYMCAPNVLATCAFNIINSKIGCQPGQVFPRVIEMYRPTSDMKHVLFVPPFLWDLKTQDFPEKQVAWLLAIPISDTEYLMAQKQGSGSLEHLFEQEQIDVFDLDRRTVL